MTHTAINLILAYIPNATSVLCDEQTYCDMSRAYVDPLLIEKCNADVAQVHLKARNYPCPLCDSSFARKDTLRRYVMVRLCKLDLDVVANSRDQTCRRRLSKAAGGQKARDQGSEALERLIIICDPEAVVPTISRCCNWTFSPWTTGTVRVNGSGLRSLRSRKSLTISKHAAACCSLRPGRHTWHSAALEAWCSNTRG